jgi:hypothetical protein
MQNEFIKKHASRIKPTWETLSFIGGGIALVWTMFPVGFTGWIINVLAWMHLNVDRGPWELILRVFLLLNGIVGVYLRTMRIHFDEALQNARRTDRIDSIRKLLISFNIIKQPALEFYDESAGDAIRNLLTLIAKYMHYSPVQLDRKCSDAGIKSNYYIYTLAASHQEEDLGIMTRYLTLVVEKIITDNSWNRHWEDGKFHLPVLIAQQNRNVILAEQVSNKTDLPILIYQPAPDSKKHTDCGGMDKYEFFYRMYLGCDTLKQKIFLKSVQEDCNSFVLHFIILDCNITRGSSFVDVIEDKKRNINFNKYVKDEAFIDVFCSDMLQNINVVFDDIRECATLFVASDKALTMPSYSLQSQLQSVSIRLWYYFVLPETVKEKMAAMKVCLKGNYNNCNFADILKMKCDDIKAITGFDNGWINAQAKTPEDLITFLPHS